MGSKEATSSYKNNSSDWNEPWTLCISGSSSSCSVPRNEEVTQLPCFHVICSENCSEKFWTQINTGAPLKCPICSVKFTSSETRRIVIDKEYPKNVEPTFEEPLKCGNCVEGDKFEAKFYCVQCHLVFCNHCQETVHSKFFQTRDHKVEENLEVPKNQRLEEYKKTKTECNVHKGQPLSSFCLTCKEKLCPECLPNHHHHTFVNIKVEMDNLATTLFKSEDLLAHCTENDTTLASEILRLQTQRTTIEQRIKDLTDQKDDTLKVKKNAETILAVGTKLKTGVMDDIAAVNFSRHSTTLLEKLCDAVPLGSGSGGETGNRNGRRATSLNDPPPAAVASTSSAARAELTAAAASSSASSKRKKSRKILKVTKTGLGANRKLALLKVTEDEDKQTPATSAGQRTRKRPFKFSMSSSPDNKRQKKSPPSASKQQQQSNLPENSRPITNKKATKSPRNAAGTEETVTDIRNWPEAPYLPTLTPEPHYKMDFPKQNPKNLTTTKNQSKSHVCCPVCFDGGDFVLCDGCPRSFHQECHIPPIPEEVIKDEKAKFYCNFHYSKSQFEEKVLRRLPVVKNSITMELDKDTNEREFLMACKFLTEVYKLPSSPTLRWKFPEGYFAKYKKVPFHLEHIRERLCLGDPEKFGSVKEMLEGIKQIFEQAYYYYSKNYIEKKKEVLKELENCFNQTKKLVEAYYPSQTQIMINYKK